LGIGDWGLGPIPNPQSPKLNSIYVKAYMIKINNNNFLNIEQVLYN